MKFMLHRAKFLAGQQGRPHLKTFRSGLVAFVAIFAFQGAAFGAPTIAGGSDVSADDPIARTTVGMVSVFPASEGSDEKNYGICTASIIEKNIAVTAAHCVKGAERVVLLFGLSMEKSEALRVVTGIVIHRDYNPGTDVNDIALVRFLGDLPTGFEPIELVPSSYVLTRGDRVTLSGYGITDLVTGSGSGTLRKVDQPFYGANVTTPNTVLFANLPSTGACPGDSGGPALIRAGKKHMLLGVASYLLVPSERPCGKASVYTDLRAESMRKFIDVAREILITSE